MCLLHKQCYSGIKQTGAKQNPCLPRQGFLVVKRFWRYTKDMSRHEHLTGGEKQSEGNEVVPLRPQIPEVQEALARHPATGKETVEETLARLATQKPHLEQLPGDNDID